MYFHALCVTDLFIFNFLINIARVFPTSVDLLAMATPEANYNSIMGFGSRLGQGVGLENKCLAFVQKVSFLSCMV